MTREPRLELAYSGCSLWLIAFSTRGALARRVPARIVACDDKVQGDAAHDAGGHVFPGR